MIDVLLMRRQLETELRIVQNVVDVFFPKTSCFGVSLEGVEYRKHESTLETNAVLIEIPVGVRIINGDERWKGGGRRVRESILGITTKDQVVQRGTETEKEPTNGLFNARGIGFSHGVETRRSTKRAWAGEKIGTSSMEVMKAPTNLRCMACSEEQRREAVVLAAISET
jgi:hypothetical protein